MTLEEARNNAPKINCFGLDVRTGQCSALQIPGLTLDMCMKCRFRKPVKDMTGRKKYPLRERKEPETQTYIRNGVLKCRRPAPERRPPDPPEEKPEDVEKAMKEAAARRRKEQAEKKEREQAEKLASKASRAMCKKCGYSLSASGGHGYMDRVCGYMLITGHRRPCLPGQCMDAGVFASRGGLQGLPGMGRDRPQDAPERQAEGCGRDPAEGTAPPCRGEGGRAGDCRGGVRPAEGPVHPADPEGEQGGGPE